MLNVHESLFKKLSWVEGMANQGQKIPKGLNLIQQEEYTARIQRNKIEEWVSNTIYKKLISHNEKIKNNSIFSIFPKSTTKERMKDFVMISMSKFNVILLCLLWEFVISLDF